MGAQYGSKENVERKDTGDLRRPTLALRSQPLFFAVITAARWLLYCSRHFWGWSTFGPDRLSQTPQIWPIRTGTQTQYYGGFPIGRGEHPLRRAQKRGSSESPAPPGGLIFAGLVWLEIEDANSLVPFPWTLGQGYYTQKTTWDPLLIFFLLVHVTGVLITPPGGTLLALCGRRSLLRSVFSRGKVKMDVHRVFCQVAEAVVVVISGTERGRGCRFSLRLETPVKGGGAFTPSWGGSVVVGFGYLVHGDGGGAGGGGL